MKKTLALILTAALALSLAACGGSKKPQEIELTTENIGDYISFSGEFTDSEYHQTILYCQPVEKVCQEADFFM